MIESCGRASSYMCNVSMSVRRNLFFVCSGRATHIGAISCRHSVESKCPRKRLSCLCRDYLVMGRSTGTTYVKLLGLGSLYFCSLGKGLVGRVIVKGRLGSPRCSPRFLSFPGTPGCFVSLYNAPGCLCTLCGNFPNASNGSGVVIFA